MADVTAPRGGRVSVHDQCPDRAEGDPEVTIVPRRRCGGGSPALLRLRGLHESLDRFSWPTAESHLLEDDLAGFIED